MVHILAVNFLHRDAYPDERYPDIAKVENENVRISSTPLDLRFVRDGLLIKGQTRIGGRLSSCPPGAIDPWF